MLRSKHMMGRRIVAFGLSAVMTMGGVPTTALAEAVEPQAAQEGLDVEVMPASLEERAAEVAAELEGEADPLAALWDMLVAVPAQGDEQDGERAALDALDGVESTPTGLAHAFAAVSAALAYDAEVAEVDGVPMACVTIDGVPYDLDVAAGSPGAYPWAVAEGEDALDADALYEEVPVEELDEEALAEEGIILLDDEDAAEAELGELGDEELVAEEEAEAEAEAEAEREATGSQGVTGASGLKPFDVSLNSNGTATTKNSTKTKSAADDSGGLEAQASLKVQYYVHRQTYGWEKSWAKSNGQTSGTTGQSKRLEGIRVRLSGSRPSGSIKYRTHIQTYGWESSWTSNGSTSGTTGKSKRLEAIQIKLTGNMASSYDVYYRVHAQQFGWMGWAKNGASAGSQGYSYRLEAIQIKLVRKGRSAPGSMAGAFRKRTVTYYSIKKADSYETNDFKVSVPSAWRGKWYVDVNSENHGKSYYFYAPSIPSAVGSSTYARGRIFVFDSPSYAYSSTWYNGSSSFTYLGRSSRGKYVYKYLVNTFFKQSGSSGTKATIRLK